MARPEANAIDTESQLDTHDVAISILPTIDPNTGHTVQIRHLRVLLLSPSATTEAKLGDTLARIQRFAALTGGEDLAIVFLLYPQKDTSFVSAKALTTNGDVSEAGANGMFAYSKLQAALFSDAAIPHVPVLPLADVQGLPELLLKHVAAREKAATSRHAPPHPAVKGANKPATPFDLLQLCTAEPPMAKHTALVAADVFTDLADLAAACTSVTTAPASSSPSRRASQGMSSQTSHAYGAESGWSTQRSTGGYGEKLKRLRILLGEKECQNLIDFWAEEWTLD